MASNKNTPAGEPLCRNIVPTDSLPTTETITPDDQISLAEIVRDAFASDTKLYPIGGGTSLDYGFPAKENGIGLSLANLNRVIDFPAGDMTITVEAGITMKQLADTLATENQRLPVDVPVADSATLGGVIATNWNGPRRYGLGNLRDYVIGIRAIDGTGREFNGGGRVVKNVAGYDFCKLLTGSFGTLGIISQVTLKLKPTVESMALVVIEVAGLESAESVLAGLVRTKTTPTAIEFVSGPMWDNAPLSGKDFIIVAFEGTTTEVEWMKRQLAEELESSGIGNPTIVSREDMDRLWSQLTEFSAHESPLTIKANVTPSGTTKFVAAARSIDPDCSIQAQAGNGVITIHFATIPDDGLSRVLIGQLQPLANSLQGNVVVLANLSGEALTHQCAWGGINAPFRLMNRVKQQFDPKNILNPGRFVFQ